LFNDLGKPMRPDVGSFSILARGESLLRARIYDEGGVRMLQDRAIRQIASGADRGCWRNEPDHW